jgi:hypothetical protein
MGCRSWGRMSVVLSLALGLTGLIASTADAMPTVIRVELAGNSTDMQMNGMAIRANPSTVQPGTCLPPNAKTPPTKTPGHMHCVYAIS